MARSRQFQIGQWDGNAGQTFPCLDLARKGRPVDHISANDPTATQPAMPRAAIGDNRDAVSVHRRKQAGIALNIDGLCANGQGVTSADPCSAAEQFMMELRLSHAQPD